HLKDIVFIDAWRAMVVPGDQGLHQPEVPREQLLRVGSNDFSGGDGHVGLQRVVMRGRDARDFTDPLHHTAWLTGPGAPGPTAAAGPRLPPALGMPMVPGKDGLDDPLGLRLSPFPPPPYDRCRAPRHSRASHPAPIAGLAATVGVETAPRR